MLAAIVGVNKTLEFPEEVIRTNTLLTMNVLEWISKNPIKRLLFSSSSENYAGTSDIFGIDIPTDESVPMCIDDIKHPRWTYAMTKMHGESAFLHSSSSYNYECVIVRYQNIIGPEMGFGHAIPHIVQRFIEGEESPFKIYGHDQTRSFCYVRDTINGINKLLLSNYSLPINIGNPHEHSILELIDLIKNKINTKGKLKFKKLPENDPKIRKPDIKLAQTVLDWNPKINISDGLDITINYFKNFLEQETRPKSMLNKDGRH